MVQLSSLSCRICLLGLLAPCLLFAEQEKSAGLPAEVAAVLKSRCQRCHGPKEQYAEIRFDTLSTDFVKDRAAAETWHEALHVLQRGEMPPEDEPQPSDQERGILTGWISGKIKQALSVQRDAQGIPTLRRLNRVEYQNTMTDLLGLEMNYTRDLPPDAVSADGFLNDAAALQMSPLQLEYYLNTARGALERVIVSGPAPEVYEYEFTEPNPGNKYRQIEYSNQLGRQQEFWGKMVDKYPEEGEFLIRVKLTAELKPKTGYPLLEVSVGYRPDTKILFREVDVVEVTTEEAQVFEFRGRVENYPLPVRGQGKFPGLIVRVRNVYHDGSPLPKGKKDKKRGTVYPKEPHLPKLNIQSVEFKAPVFDQWPPELHRRILFPSKLREENESEYVAEVLRRFLKRAYRRPARREEVQSLVAFYHEIRPEFPDFASAMRETLAFVLIRPEFLYLAESEGSGPLNDWELATRLSYFLWSTMPDERLFELAESGKLRQPEVLRAVVERLLKDKRSQRFVDQFTEQWLHLNVVDQVAVSREYYPKFEEDLKPHLKAETQRFFGELLRRDASALHLLDGDFTMLNEPLAKHYGIDGIYGQAFRAVPLGPEQHRGGLLAQASILLSNSTGEDSHAVRRAVWIRDRLLDDPPASPPPDVPSLDEADPKFFKLSIREQLEIHRGTNACAACHRGIDPWGIALENFDAVGLWREEVRRKSGKSFTTQPVNAKDTLPNGTELDGFAALKNYLVNERKDDFARSLVSRLLTYALGRRLELEDEQAVAAITNEFATQNYRLRELIHGIVASPAFQTK